MRRSLEVVIVSKNFNDSWEEDYVGIKHIPKSSKNKKKYGDGGYQSKDKMKSKKNKNKRYKDGLYK